MSEWQIFLFASLGAAAQELLWWYNVRFSLDEIRYKAARKSLGYWVITIGFVTFTGAVALAWYSGSASPTSRDCLLFGAAMPLIIKQGVRAVQPEQQLGDKAPRFSFWDYFR